MFGLFRKQAVIDRARFLRETLGQKTVEYRMAKAINQGKLSEEDWRKYIWTDRFYKRVSRVAKGESPWQPGDPMIRFETPEEIATSYEGIIRLTREHGRVLEE